MKESAVVSGLPAVSVIIPAFNAERSIVRCINSLRSQDLENFEVVVVDDHSSDRTPEIIRELASVDPRVIPIFLPENRGVHDARRAGFSISRGRFIGFVDADDYVAPNMYSTLSNLLVQSASTIAICSASLIAEGREIGTRIKIGSTKVVSTDTLSKFCRLKFGSGVLWNKLYAREVIEGPLLAHVDLSAGEDYVVNVGAFHNASSVVLCRKKLYNYVVHSSNASRQTGWLAFARLLRAYAVCLETYVPSNPTLAPMIDELFLKQAYFPTYKVPESPPSADTARELGEYLRRIAEVSPRSLYNILHSVPLWHARLRRLLTASSQFLSSRKA